MSQTLEIGQKVEWDWGNGVGTGRVTEIFTDNVSRKIKGTEVVRTADTNNPAYLIEQDDGDVVLKSNSEIRLA